MDVGWAWLVDIILSGTFMGYVCFRVYMAGHEYLWLAKMETGKEMTLSDLILTKLKAGHRGLANAIKRRDLLQYLYEIGAIDKISETEDRLIRMLIDEMPRICSSLDGYYIAREKADVDQSIKHLSKKAMAILRKIRRKKEAYPQYYLPDQGELFR